MATIAARSLVVLAVLVVWTLAVGGVVALAAGGAAFAHYLGMLAFVLFVVATLSTARAFRRQRVLSRRVLLIMGLLPLAMAVLQIALSAQGRLMAVVVGVPAGAAAGVIWALLTRVETDGEGLRIAGTVPALIVWATLIGLVQIVRLVGSEVAGLLLAVVVAQSTAFGVWALVLLRRGSASATPAAVLAPPAPPSPAVPSAAPSSAASADAKDLS